MSQPKLRHGDHYKAVTEELRRAGYDWREEIGGKHAKLIVDVHGREETVPLALTPSDWRASKNAVGDIRQRIRRWDAEAASGEIVLVEYQGEPRIDDITVGARLGYGRPGRLRELINRNRKELEALGGLPTRSVNPGNKGGRPSKAFLLNDEQVRLVSLKSGAENALVVQAQVKAAFVAWGRERDGLIWDEVESLRSEIIDLRLSISDIQDYLTDPSSLDAALEMAGTVTAAQAVEMSGVCGADFSAGICAAATNYLKNFCLKHGHRAFRAPKDIDAKQRWRFPRNAVQDWLVTGGKEHVMRQAVAHRVIGHPNVHLLADRRKG